ncbi:MAG: hypothetical protein H6510_12045 [Acidobacteria bacterium]|nr:hypothetical protein [Acidobacteriota bacterium]MCB9398538.1 hypothetical protein [Acidobacteriota bacterium]
MSKPIFRWMCLLFPVLVVACAPRFLRISGVYQAVGVALFLGFCLLIWAQAKTIWATNPQRVVAGVLLMLPWAIFALFWVGLGPPWLSTLPENVMRYAVLLMASAAIYLGFSGLLHQLPKQPAGVDWVPYCKALINLASAGYMVWCCFQLGFFVNWIREGDVSADLKFLNNVMDSLLFADCLMTYAATLLLLVLLAQHRWVRPRFSFIFGGICTVALIALALRGFSFPHPGSEPWYLQPGFVVGIPAVPWLIPYWIGAACLKPFSSD